MSAFDEDANFAKLSADLAAHNAHNQASRRVVDDVVFWEKLDKPLDKASCNISRVNFSTTTKADFVRDFCDSTVRPAMISGLTDAWPAKKRWQLDTLLATFGDIWFTISGGQVRLRDYEKYVASSQADWPFYVFESDFDVFSGRARLLEDYVAPEWFDDQLRMPPGQRPASKYFLVGPRGSGTNIHTDPMSTSAWNALLVGRKRWCLFPPTTVWSDIYPAQGKSKTRSSSFSLSSSTLSTSLSLPSPSSSSSKPSSPARFRKSPLIKLVIELKAYEMPFDWNALGTTLVNRSWCEATDAVAWGRREVVSGPYGIETLQVECTLDSSVMEVETLCEAIAESLEEFIQSVDITQRCVVPPALDALPCHMCPAYWFQDVYPTLVDRTEELGMVDLIQEAGETIFVPVGWHHVVLNLEWTVAITHNFIPEALLVTSFTDMARKNPTQACAWFKELANRQPGMAELVGALVPCPEGP